MHKNKVVFGALLGLVLMLSVTSTVVMPAYASGSPDAVYEKISFDYECESGTFTLTQGDEAVSIQEYDQQMSPVGSPVVLTPNAPTKTIGLSPGSHWFSAEMNGRQWSIDPVIDACEEPPPPPPPLGDCDLVITKSADVKSARVGELITFTIRFENVGDGDCTGSGVRVLDLLDSDVKFVSAYTSGNVRAGYNGLELHDSVSHSVNANANKLTPGESGWVKVAVRVTEPESCGDFVVTNKSQIAAKELNPGSWGDGFGVLSWVTSNTVSVEIDNNCPPPPPPPPPNVDEKVAIDLSCESITFILTQGDEAVGIQEYDEQMNPVGSPIVLTLNSPTATRSVPSGRHWYSSTLNGRTKQWDPVIEKCSKELPRTTITVIKRVVNDDGGTKSVSSFTLYLNGSKVLSNATNSVKPGTYTVSEDQLDGYEFAGFGGDCDTNGVVSVEEGESATCVITNDDIAVPPPPPPGDCELVIVKEADATQVVAGDLVTFTLRFENVGDGDCTGNGTWVRDSLDTLFGFVSVDMSKNVKAGYDGTPLYDSNTRSVNANAGVLVPGETGWIKITVRVLESEFCGSTTVENNGMITAREYNSDANWHIDGWNDLTWVYSNPVSVTVNNDCQEAPEVPDVPDMAVPGCNEDDGGFIDITRGDTGGEEAFTVYFGDGVTGAFVFEGGQGSMRIPLANGEYVVMIGDAEYEVAVDCNACPAIFEDPDVEEVSGDTSYAAGTTTTTITENDTDTTVTTTGDANDGNGTDDDVADVTAESSDLENTMKALAILVLIAFGGMLFNVDRIILWLRGLWGDAADTE